MPTEDGNEAIAVLRIRRRPTIQDLVRRYVVFIDGVASGSIWPCRSRSFCLSSGRHEVQLRIVRTGSSQSDEVKVDVKPGQVLKMRTGSISAKQFVQLPLALQNPDRFAPRPWIRLEVD